MKGAGEPWEGRPTEESELIERAQRGDAMAYEELVRRHQDAALRTAGLVLAGGAESEDAVQDAFVKAYVALGRFHAEAPFRPWILRIVANEARNRRRSAGRRAGLAVRLAEDRPSDGAAPSPEAAVLAREQRIALLSAIESLSVDDRLVLGYRYFLDLGEAEMADALGIARGTVKSRLSRALTRLRAQIGPGSPLRPGSPIGPAGGGKTDR
jgi:RNA polymerase sigma-70 factor, ECF subfamily